MPWLRAYRRVALSMTCADKGGVRHPPTPLCAVCILLAYRHVYPHLLNEVSQCYQYTEAYLSGSPVRILYGSYAHEPRPRVGRTLQIRHHILFPTRRVHQSSDICARSVIQLRYARYPWLITRHPKRQRRALPTCSCTSLCCGLVHLHLALDTLWIYCPRPPLWFFSILSSHARS